MIELGRPEASFSRAGWRTDFEWRRVLLEEIRSGGPARDGIPPIDHPRAVEPRAAERLLSKREPVIVVEAGEAVRAYPVRILVWHEIVNDRLGGRSIAVTYSPLSNSSLVFDRRVRARELSFGTTGNLRRSNLVMWDRQTQTWWQQLTAEAIVGKLAGERLRPLPAQTPSWAQFKRRFPDGDALAPETGAREREYDRNPYLATTRPPAGRTCSGDRSTPGSLPKSGWSRCSERAPR